jgi:hypothetical protein
MPRATTLGQRADGVRVMAYEDPSGSRLAVTVDARNNITCFTPSFRGSPRRVQTLGFSPHECEFEQPLNIELRDLTGGTEMPLAVQLEDAALVPQVLSMDAAITLRVAGLVEGCEWWQNDDAYNATGKQLAVESFIPSGTFPADQQWADFVVRSTDFVVLSMPEVAGLPFVITGLVMAGGLAAALSTADGLLLTIANAISHDLYYNVIDPSATLVRRLTITKVLLVVTALVSAYTATFRFAVIAELVAWAFSLAGASFFPALVMGIWWKRANKAGAVVGMIAGLGVTTYYMIGSRFFGVSWFGTQTIASAIFGLPVGFIVIWIVSLLTAPPPQAVQDLVVSVRYPKSGQATARSAQGIQLGEH